MLRELRVRNYAIIESLSVEFTQGFNVLSGETGAGKSIVIGALGLVLGHRAFTEMIRTGAQEASAEALFDIEDAQILKRHDIAEMPDGGLIVRRVISKNGKSRAYVNDTLVSAQTLQDIGRTLVDIHGQHENQSLLAPESRLQLIDRYGKLETERAAVGEAFSEVQSLRKLLDDIRLGARERARRLDLLKFQVQEIEEAGLEEGEDLRLEERREILANLSKLNEFVNLAYGKLQEDDGAALEMLGAATHSLEDITSIDPDGAAALEALSGAIPLIEDTVLCLRKLRDKYDMDPGELDAVQERLEVIAKLKKKYGDTVAAIIAFKDESASELARLQDAEESASEIEQKLSSCEEALSTLAEALSAKRKRAARKIESAVLAELKDLALEKASFAIGFRDVPCMSTGADDVEFLFSANPGEELKPLEKVASGGELSRIMLAVKGVLKEIDRVPVMVFDEVDAGIGGATAQNVGAKLKSLANKRQVLCITHLPQIASLAARHLLIEKLAPKGRAQVTVRPLEGIEREEEIARMLGGEVTDVSLRHARELMGKGR